MKRAEQLREGRNLLLKLHKELVDHERGIWEGINGEATAAQFLNVLLEDPEFSWLRRFSTLIVDIDEMFAQKDGYAPDAVQAHLESLRDLVSMSGGDEDFNSRYQTVLQQNPEAAARQADLKLLLRPTD